MEFKMFSNKTITQFSTPFKYYDCKFKTPDGLFNFDIEIDNEKYLVLDNYGDETLTPSIKARLFQGVDDPYLVIRRSDGQMFSAVFIRSKRNKLGKRKYGMVLQSTELPCVPKEFMNCIDHLKYQKRPFRFSLSEYTLVNLLDRELGFNNIKVDVYLNFDDYYIRISHDNSYTKMINYDA
jgi:hypothetical protein